MKGRRWLLFARTNPKTTQLALMQIRSMRVDLMAKVDVAQPDIQELQLLVVVDRYERYAHTKRRRASVKF